MVDEDIFDDESETSGVRGQRIDLPDFIRPREVYRRPEPERNVDEKHGVIHGVDRKFRTNREGYGFDQNVIAVWEVITEVMYVNGWNGKTINQSRKQQEQLADIVLMIYEEKGWMVNPRRASVMGQVGLAKGSNLSQDTWIEMADNKRWYIISAVHSLMRETFNAQLNAGNRVVSFDPENSDTWPPGLHIALDPTLRKYDTYHPSRWHAGSYTPPDIISDGMPWYQKALVPVAHAWSWFLSLTTKAQAAIVVLTLLIVWALIAILVD